MADTTETQELEAATHGNEPDLAQGDLAYRMSHAAPNLLPGEVKAHPDPWQYVVVTVVLAVITGVEIAGLYWHFVDVVWIVIFTVIYLLPK